MRLVKSDALHSCFMPILASCRPLSGQWHFRENGHFRTARYGIYILKPQNYHRRTMKSKTLRYVETLAARRNHSTPQNDLAKESPSRQESKARVGKDVPLNHKIEEMKQILLSEMFIEHIREKVETH